MYGVAEANRPIFTESDAYFYKLDVKDLLVLPTNHPLDHIMGYT